MLLVSLGAQPSVIASFTMDLFWFRYKLIQLRLWLGLKTRPVALDSTAIGTLPTEIVCHIASFLSLDSAALFSLCCLQIFSTLGDGYLKALEKEESTRFKFLSILEPGLPEHILCYHCKKLHNIRAPPSYFWIDTIYDSCRGSLLLCWKEEANYEYHHPAFSFSVFQMIKKRYHQGRDYSSLLNTIFRNTQVWANCDYIWQYKSLAQIVAGSLLFRDQIIVGVPPSKQNEDFRGYRICRHIYISSIRPLYPHPGTTETIRANYGDYSCSFSDGTYRLYIYIDNGWKYLELRGATQCKYCWTEFEVGFTEFEASIIGIFITRWKDLGCGSSPDEHKWKSQQSDSFEDRTTREAAGFEPGSFRFAFEEKVDPKFEFRSLLSPKDKRKFSNNTPRPWN